MSLPALIRLVLSQTGASLNPFMRYFGRYYVAVAYGALLLILLTVSPLTQATDPATAKLSAQALQNVLADIARMRKAKEQEITQIHLAAANLNELEHFYHDAELAKHSRSVRENGLILAGAGSRLFAISKPSDISRKMADWFAEEMRSAQANQRLSQSDIRLWGPYENYSDDAAVFTVLWSCLPRQAWLRPELNPYRIEFALLGTAMLPVNARSSNRDEQDFAYCMELNIGYRLAQDDAEELVKLSRNQLIARRLRVLLPEYLARFLQTQGCSGQGPDDCVLLLATWASLDPASKALAQLLQKLEPELEHGLQTNFNQLTKFKPIKSNQSYEFADANQYFDQILRQLIFLKVKWHAQQHHPEIWSATSSTQTLKQIFSLVREFEHPYVSQFQVYQEALKQVLAPTELLIKPTGSTDGIQLLAWLDQQENCQALRLVLPLETQNHTVLKSLIWQVLAQKRLPNCLQLHSDYSDQNRLIEQSLSATESEQQRLLQILPELPGTMRHHLLEFLGGHTCATPQAKDLPVWKRRLCQQWVSEPIGLTHPQRLKHSGLRLRQSDEFNHQNLSTSTLAIKLEEPNWAMPWLKSLAVFKTGDYDADLPEVANYLQKHVSDFNSVSLYSHPKSAIRLLVISGQLKFSGSDRQWQNYNDSQLLIELRKQSAHIITVPGYFTFQYDSGGITKISDLDGDGNLEVWFAGTEGECDGEGAVEGVDCASPVYKMGEISDNTISWFRKNTPPPQPENLAQKTQSQSKHVKNESK